MRLAGLPRGGILYYHIGNILSTVFCDFFEKLFGFQCRLPPHFLCLFDLRFSLFGCPLFKAPDYNTKFPSLCQPLFLIFFRFFSYSDILISPRAFTSIYSMLYRLKCYCVSWHLMRYLPSRILLCRFLSARRKKEPGIATWKIAIPGGLFICFS